GSQQIVRAREIPGGVIVFGSGKRQLLVRGWALQAAWLQPAEVDLRLLIDSGSVFYVGYFSVYHITFAQIIYSASKFPIQFRGYLGKLCEAEPF
ncbi:hypothetical protein, partial [Phormidium sp. CCY1219]|uniref:hypothetical protein n=1 Tax=Phormidium sp. CCY1219 TaxID=2886104 RepID=UPI002D1EE10D